jgi:hypothetical protein
MPNIADAGVLKLIDFDRRWLSRVVHIVHGTRKVKEIEFTYAELLEGYFWLALGAELNYFPRDEAELLARQRFAPLKDRTQAAFTFSDYRLDENLKDRLATDNNLGTMLSQEVNQGFEHPTILLSYFEEALELETEFASDDELGTLLRALVISDTEDIARVLDEEDEVIVRWDACIDKKLLLRSFAFCLHHMESFSELEGRVAQDEQIPFEDRVLFKARIRQLVRWRINFASERFEESFRRIAKEIYGPVEDQTDFEDYINWFNGLARSWKDVTGTARM